MSSPRTIAQLGYPVSDDVLHVIDLLQNRYGAARYRDSGHTQGRPTWIFELPRYGAEVGVPMNRRDLTLYMRNRTLGGQKLTDLLPIEKISKVYPRDGNPGRSIKDSPFMGIGNGNECVMLDLERDDLVPLFDAFFGAGNKPSTLATAPNAVLPAAAASASANAPSSSSTAPATNAEAFAALLERRSELGQAGELLAVQDELSRLARCGCPDPATWVERVALSDVGRGYDIASTWPGHERCIEVKTSTARDNPLFVTANERQVLAKLGDRAWMYRVVVRADGNGEVLDRVCNPMAALTETDFEPVVFRVGGEAWRRVAGS